VSIDNKKALKLPDQTADLFRKNIDTVVKPVKEPVKPTKKGSIKVSMGQKSYGGDNAIKDESLILKQNPDLYTIQLLGSIDKQYLIRFARTHGIENRVAYYHKIHKGRDWYSLIYGLYSGLSKAMEDVKSLPDELNFSSPWVQRIGSIQNKIYVKGSDSERNTRVD
jgi:septal ring-binding cell division protein DamX